MNASRTELFRQVLLSLLRPVARAMIAHGVTLNMATEVLKRVLVEEAARSSTGPDGITDSQVSLLTGLHRKDVKRLRQDDPPPPRRPLLNACALAIGTWTTQPEFLDEDGNPRPLVRSGSPGFDDLVRGARIDLPPATVLEALKAHDAVTQVGEDGPITLVRDAFIAGPQSEERLQAYEKNLRAHLDAATANLLSEGDRLQFERAGHYNRLPAAAVAELEGKARDLAMTMLTEVNKLALEHQREAANDKDATHRFTVGAYILGDGEVPGTARKDDSK